MAPSRASERQPPSSEAAGPRAVDPPLSSHSDHGNQNGGRRSFRKAFSSRNAVRTSVRPTARRNSSLNPIRPAAARMEAVTESATEALDDEMLAKIVALRHGPSFVRRGNAATGKSDPNERSTLHDSEVHHASIVSQSSLTPAADAAPYQRQNTPNTPGAFHREGNSVVKRTRASLHSKPAARLDGQQTAQLALPFHSEHGHHGRVAQVNQSRHPARRNSTPASTLDGEDLQLEKLFAMEHGPSGSTSNVAADGDGIDRVATDAGPKKPSGASIPVLDTAPLERQQTPTIPGAFHREGNSIVPRERKWILTSAEGRKTASQELTADSQENGEKSEDVANPRAPKTPPMRHRRQGGMVETRPLEEQQTAESVWLEKMIAARLGPTSPAETTHDATHSETSQPRQGSQLNHSVDLETLLNSQNDNSMLQSTETSDTDRWESFAVEHEFGNCSNNTSAPFKRQATPQEPGAFCREGPRIVPRGKGNLTDPNAPVAAVPSSKRSRNASASSATARPLGVIGSAASATSDPHRRSRQDHILEYVVDPNEKQEQKARSDLPTATGAHSTKTRNGDTGQANTGRTAIENLSGVSIDLEEILTMRHGNSIVRSSQANEEPWYSSDVDSRRSQFRRLENGSSVLGDDNDPPSPLSDAAHERLGDDAASAKIAATSGKLNNLSSSQVLHAARSALRSSTKSEMSGLDLFSARTSSGRNYSIISDDFTLGYATDMNDVEDGIGDHPRRAAPPYEPGGVSFRLVEAREVTEESSQELFSATPMDLAGQASLQQSSLAFPRKVAGGVCLGLVVIIMILILTVGLASRSEPSGATLEPTIAPTLAPTAIIILDLPETTQEQIVFDPDGPQARAYKWLLDDPSWPLYSQERLLQRFALSVLYYSTNLRPGNESLWTKAKSWLSFDVHECEWAFRGGPELRPCGSEGGNTSEAYKNLLLYGNGLRGSFPQEIFLLTSLERIDLQENELVGNLPVPSWLGDSPHLFPHNLSILALVNNQLDGSLPTELGCFTKLQALYLGSNQFTGVIPTEIGQATDLVDFALEVNKLEGTIPSQLAYLKSLVQISLGGNMLTGKLSPVFPVAKKWSVMATEAVPGFGGEPLFPFLREFDVSDNLLSGPIPPELGLSCPNLTRLVMASNRLSGDIPSQIGKIQSLTTLDLQHNRLAIPQLPTELGLLTSLVQLKLSSQSTILGGTLPSELGLLSSIGELQLDASSFSITQQMLLYGTIPTEIGQMGNLTALVLSGNRLVGPIPTELGKMTRLENLSLSNNGIMETTVFGLQGQLPSELGRLPLRELILSENSLSGSIPSELGQLSLLESLSLHTNRLSNTFPQDLGKGMPNVRNLLIYRNFISGTIPAEGIRSMPNLESFSCYSNRLQGGIPTQFGLLKKIRTFRAENNYFTGTIPSEIGRTENLDTLVLTGSGIRGSLPSELGQLRASLLYLYLGGNLMTGTIPTTFGLLSNLIALDIPLNGFVGRIPSELGIMTSLRELHLYQNFLSGAIPSEIGALGNSMTKIYLLGNSLSSSIPTEVGQLTLLEELSFSKNMMTGRLPSEMGMLTKLSILAAAENRFGNRIPSELGALTKLGQLQLNNNLFIGSLSTELGRLDSLVELLVEENQLGRNLPTQIGQLTKLERLRFQSNAFSGFIPTEVGLLTSLLDMSFSGNKMNGTIPFENLSNLTGLQWLWVAENAFSGTLSTHIGLLSDSLSVFSVRNNKLSGTVPSQVGQLVNLISLELDFNPLTGTVPTDLVFLTKLIDGLSGVTGTNLTGTIPEKLCPKLLFVCSDQLCGCECNCTQLIEVEQDATAFLGMDETTTPASSAASRENASTTAETNTSVLSGL